MYAYAGSIQMFQNFTSHAFVYDSYFVQLQKSECCGAIIFNRYYSPVCVLEDKYRTNKNALNNVLRKFFEGSCIVGYAFKVTANYIS